ncbi:MAG: DEAD/DEAH box helicase [Gammaproteobacteria bacterium]|nr:DEAD/DEAH box helicase [Gammaproteobacteria bacterium]
MEGDSHKRLVDCLSLLGVSTLIKFLGHDQAERLQSLGLQLSSKTIAEFMVSAAGVEVFRDRELRLHLIQSLDPKALLSFFSEDPAVLGDAVVRFNKFNWGCNQSSRKFLALFELPGELLDKPQIDNSSSVDLSIENPLHRYQNWLRKKVVKELIFGTDKRFLLHMPTGSGKTRTSLESLIDYVRCLEDTNSTFVWFAHSEELCEQAAEAFEQLWSRRGSEDAQLIKLWGGKKLPALNDNGPIFVVTSFQTAYQYLHTADDQRFSLFSRIRATCSVLIVDEAHQSTAPTYQAAIELFANKNSKIIGLTATPGRHHVGQSGEETDDLAEFYCCNKITIVGDQGEELKNPIEFLTNRGILSITERYQLNSHESFDLSPSEIQHISNQLDIPSSLLETIGKNAARTNLVATQVRKIVNEENASIIVFAPSKDNANELASLLIFSGIEARSVTGESTAIARREAILAFRQGTVSVLVNFGVLTTGFDSPNIDAVIVARPTTSVVLYSQMIGRGLRGPAMGGTKRCKVIDVIDNIKNMPKADAAFTFFDTYYS